MKKYIIPTILSIVIGFYLGKILLGEYKNANELIPVFGNELIQLYFVRQGEYNTLEEMETAMIKFPYYIHTIKDEKYLSYIGISSNEQNANKIKGYYDNMGYNTIVEKIGTSNSDFVSVLTEYDKLIQSSTDSTIGSVCSQILIKYEELVLNEQIDN